MPHNTPECRAPHHSDRNTLEEKRVLQRNRNITGLDTFLFSGILQARDNITRLPKNQKQMEVLKPRKTTTEHQSKLPDPQCSCRCCRQPTPQGDSPRHCCGERSEEVQGFRGPPLTRTPAGRAFGRHEPRRGQMSDKCVS